MFSRNFGLSTRQSAGTRINAQIRHTKTEKMMRNAKYFIVKKDDTKRIVNPNITEKALITIPLPVVLWVAKIASICDLPEFNSC